MLSGGCHTVGDVINTEKLYLNFGKCCFGLPSSALCAATLYPHRCFVFWFFYKTARGPRVPFQTRYYKHPVMYRLLRLFYGEYHTLKHQGCNHYCYFYGFWRYLSLKITKVQRVDWLLYMFRVAVLPYGYNPSLMMNEMSISDS